MTVMDYYRTYKRLLQTYPFEKIFSQLKCHKIIPTLF